MKFTHSILLLSVPLLTQAATITLFGVQVTTGFPTPSETFKALGVGEDGATTYANVIVVSELVVGHLNGGTTYTSAGKTVTEHPPLSTITQAPQTFEGTLVADASQYVYYGAPNPSDSLSQHAVLSCTLDGKGGGSCVQEVRVPDKTTFTDSYTGSAIPVYTIITANDQNDDTKDNDNAKGDDNTKNNDARSDALCIGWGVVSMGVFFGAYLGL